MSKLDKTTYLAYGLYQPLIGEDMDYDDQEDADLFMVGAFDDFAKAVKKADAYALAMAKQMKINYCISPRIKAESMLHMTSEPDEADRRYVFGLVDEQFGTIKIKIEKLG